MTHYLLTYGLPCLLAIVSGALAGGLTAWRLRRSSPAAEAIEAEPDNDEWIDAEMQLAAVRWAEATNQPPDAASLMFERLRTLRKIGQRKGWTE